MKPCIGAVVIGRNEGVRLQVCLQSLVEQVDALVYVDSGSTDNSLHIAQQLDVNVVNLDLDIPFTAARARNAGFKWLKENFPEIELVQFIDGDCQLRYGWLELGRELLQKNSKMAIACGCLKERNPEISIYNTLCDIEWDIPSGDVTECGGIFMIKTDVFDQLGGFRESLIAGEEPELCVRVRQIGCSIHRLENNMAWHDANMTQFSQWWKRALRSGHAYAESAWLQRGGDERYSVRDVCRIWFWGLSFPLLILMATIWPVVVVGLMVYPIQMWRIYHHSYLHRTHRDRRLFAFFCVLSNFPSMLGQVKFHFNRLRGNKSQIIEYK